MVMSSWVVCSRGKHRKNKFALEYFSTEDQVLLDSAEDLHGLSFPPYEATGSAVTTHMCDTIKSKSNIVLLLN